MRRFALATILFASLGLVAVPSALATFHLAKVSEVSTSNHGSTAEQFVELQDPAEPFPAGEGPYWLVVYNAAGVELGSQQLSNTTLAAAAAKGPMLISTAAFDAAAGTTGNFTLNVALPTVAGQACFAHTAGKSPVQCMTWGTIEKGIPNPLSPASGGQAPCDGLSLQRQSNGTTVVGTRTPGAPNTSVAAACSGPGPGGGGPGSGGGGGSGTSSSSNVSVKKRTVVVGANGKAPFSLHCAASAGGKCRGTLLLLDGKRHVGSSSFSIAAGRNRTVKVKLSSFERSKVSRLGKVKLKLQIKPRGGGKIKSMAVHLRSAGH